MIRFPLYVTLDTNIFEENKFDFGPDSTMNLLCKNVKNKKIKLVLSDIVIREVEKHICQRVDDVCGKARKLRKVYLEILPEQFLADIGLGVYTQIPAKKAIHQYAKDVFEKFLGDCEVEQLNTEGINLEEILDNYFAIRPPFENSEKKRKEFPDAFIAAEIQRRFGTEETVAIVSKDHGFIAACTETANHLFFPSLGELYDAINKHEEEYAAALEFIKNNTDSIMGAIGDRIDDSCVKVHGLSYDRDGIPDGYAYDETYLENYDLSDISLHTIDDIDGKFITASFWSHCNMTVECYYYDTSTAIWDPEEQEYYAENIHIQENHDVRFPCRVKIDSTTGEIVVLPLSIILGGDSRKSRIEIDD